MDHHQLNKTFEISNILTFIEGDGGLPFISIQNKSSTALISLYGAQVLSFKPNEIQQDLLFLSNKAIYDGKKAIRGGIPICWPWFGPDSKNSNHPNHGFARNCIWTVSKTEAVSDFETQIKLQLVHTPKTQEIWPYAFELRLLVTIGESLTLELETRNIDDKAFSVTQAFHAYFQVEDVKNVEVFGLQNAKFLDNLNNLKQKKQIDRLTISEEVDRIYIETENQLIIDDSALNRRVEISSNSKSVVVWNPWINKSATMMDLESDDYKRFVCVETGHVATDEILVLPGKTFSLLTNYRRVRL